jgi:Archaeal/vacuolar-type H+-ATPase subunit E
MAAIDEKLKLFSRIVLEKVQKDSEQKVIAFTGEYDRRIEIEKQNILKESETTINQAKKKAEQKRNQIISKVNIDGQYELLKTRKNIFDQVMEDIRKMAEDYTSEPEYLVYLEKSIANGLSKFDGDEVVIFLKSGDIERYSGQINRFVNKYKKAGMQVAVEATVKPILGGCILEDRQRKMRIDCSMASAIEENRMLIGKELNDNLQ